MKTSGTRAESSRSWSALRWAVVIGGVVALLASMSAAATGSPPPQLQVEVPEISSGAYIDQLIQSNPEAFRAGPAPPGPDAPPLGSSFDAITFDADAALNGFYQIPPDPSGAVGPAHFVNVVNSAIEWYTKPGGVLEVSSPLSGFFAAAPTPPVTGTFDPKVIYDQYAGRFVVTTMERVEPPSSATNESRVYFAVSDDSNPNGTWYFHTMTTEEFIGGDDTWADFPGLAVDSEAIYYTNNQFTHSNQTPSNAFAGQRLRIVAKAPFYTGGAAVATSYDTPALATATPGDDGAAIATTMQPTQMYGDTPGGVGNYLMAYSGINDGTSTYVQMIQVDSPLSSPTFRVWLSLWGTIAASDAIGFPLAGAPQSGTAALIATNDRRVSQNAVQRGGKIYFAVPIRPPTGVNAGQTTAHWFKVDPVTIATTASNPPPDDQGNIGGEDIATGTHTFFPSVAVDMSGNLAIGFAASASTIFPGAYYTARAAADPAGTTELAGTLRAGLDYYERTFGGPLNRWGDYSGIWLDPSDDKTFCVYNEYALVRGTPLGGEEGRWGTAWGCFIWPGPTAVTMRSFTASSSRSSVVLSWRSGSDLAVLGYNVYGDLHGKRVKLNRSLIASSGSTRGSTYRFTYRHAPGKPSVARFWLQRVNRDGSRAWHGPARVR